MDLSQIKKDLLKAHSIQKKQHRASYTISPVQGSVIFRQVRVEMWFPLWQKTQGVSNWEAMKMLVEAFSLPVDTKNTNLTKQKVQELERKRKQEAKIKKVEKNRWVNRVDELKAKIEMYENLLKCEHIPVFSSVWCWCVDLRMKSIVELNEICGLETMGTDLKLPIRQGMKTRKAG